MFHGDGVAIYAKVRLHSTAAEVAKDAQIASTSADIKIYIYELYIYGEWSVGAKGEKGMRQQQYMVRLAQLGLPKQRHSSLCTIFGE